MAATHFATRCNRLYTWLQLTLLISGDRSRVDKIPSYPHHFFPKILSVGSSSALSHQGGGGWGGGTLIFWAQVCICLRWVCLNVGGCVHVVACVCMWLHVCLHLGVCVYVVECVCMFLHVCLQVGGCVYVVVCVCMLLHVYV